VRIWDVATATERALLTGNTDTVTGVAIAPDGTWLATTSYDGTARIWDLATAANVATMRVDGPLHAVAVVGHTVHAGGARGLYAFRYEPPAP
jgi:WD40 repeat protein